MISGNETKPPLHTRRGLEVHETNPFVSGALANTKNGVKKITDKSGNRMMVVDNGTGEVMQTPAGFWYGQEVDKTQFVKLYVNGVKAFRDLTGAGTKVFEVLYLEVQKQIGKDRVFLASKSIDQTITPMSKATYQRGLKELVDKGFVAPCTVQGWFFINPDYMWNGDRLAFVKEYRLAGSSAKPKKPAPIDDKTQDMFDQKP